VDEEMEEVEEMEEIELSSDEDEGDDDEVSLIVLKRPPITERVIEEVEVRKIYVKKPLLVPLGAAEFSRDERQIY
jgi:hypothetical protein